MGIKGYPTFDDSKTVSKIYINETAIKGEIWLSKGI